MNALPLKTRLVLSLGGNLLRALLGFATSITVARGLSPATYGDLMFLLGSFTAVRSLLDLGTSSAFYTFISQRRRHWLFFLYYYGWLAVQFLATLLVVGLVLPSAVVQKIWVGHELGVVMWAAAAAFVQQQLWPSIGQVADSMRRTLLSQASGLLSSLAYLAVMIAMMASGYKDVSSVLTALALTYAMSTAVAGGMLFRGGAQGEKLPAPRLGRVIKEFAHYCRPLAALALVSCAYEFADKWLLQRYAGAAEQGYFQVANQIASVSLLVTTAVLPIFWKEIAAAWEEKDNVRAQAMYRKTCKSLVFLGALCSGLLVPWAELIVRSLLGPAYADAWPVLGLMLLYPIHQALGQINGTTLLATGQTNIYFSVSSVMMLLSIPMTLLLLAPADGAIQGLGLGAIGLALKMVALGIVSTNVQGWALARHHGWRYEWLYQPLAIAILLGSGYLSWFLGYTVFPADLHTLHSSLPAAALSLVIHLSIATAILTVAPQLAGFRSDEVAAFAARLKRSSLN